MTSSERDATIVRLFPIVRTIARAVSRRIPRVEMDDLVGEGCIGLIRAVDAYDPSRGDVTLERYARSRILGAMLNGVRRMDYLSEYTRRVLRKADADRYATAVVRGELPSIQEMERRHGKLRFARVAAHQRHALSLDDGLPVDALLAADWESDPARTYAAREARGSLQKAIGRLPSRHRQVLDMYYYSECRLEIVARRLSVTKQRIAQLRNDALKIVRREVLAS